MMRTISAIDELHIYLNIAKISIFVVSRDIPVNPFTADPVKALHFAILI